MISFRQLFSVPEFPDIEPLLHQIDKTANEIDGLTKRLDCALCSKCGPHKTKLRQLAVRLKSAQVEA